MSRSAETAEISRVMMKGVASRMCVAIQQEVSGCMGVFRFSIFRTHADVARRAPLLLISALPRTLGRSPALPPRHVLELDT